MKVPASIFIGAVYASTWWAACRWPTFISEETGREIVSPIWALPTIGTAILLIAGIAYCYEHWDD